MKNLIIPPKLNEGDTVAFISISGGRAGDEDMIPRYMLGKRRFEKIFNVKVKAIRTLNVKPKKRRVGRYTGLTNRYKKAIVTLAEGQTIDLG